MNTSIKVKNLNFKYNSEKIIFKNINFKISPGEKVAIMWENGAWKTTLLNLITWKEEWDFDGEIFVDKNVKIWYWEQAIDEKFLGHNIFDYFLDAKWILETSKNFLVLTEIFEKNKFIDKKFSEIRKKYPELEKNFLNVQKNFWWDLEIFLKEFEKFNESEIIPEIFLDEETALNFLIEIEEISPSETCQQEQNFLEYAKIFLENKKNFTEIEEWKNLNLNHFLQNLKKFFEYEIKKYFFTEYFYENFMDEWMELLWDLQEKYQESGAYEIERKVENALKILNLDNFDYKNTKISTLSWWQKNRLILAKTIFLEPEILILDEPTNNLDKKSYENLSNFAKKFKGTMIVVSHDPNFLNIFVNKVLYLDIYQSNVREYYWNYKDVETEVYEQMERDRRKMHRLEAEIKTKEKIIHKREQQAQIYWSSKLAQNVKQLKKKVKQIEEKKWDILKEDRVISNFTIPCQLPDWDILNFYSIEYFEDWEVKNLELNTPVLKWQICVIHGKNWKWKTMFLRKFVEKNADCWYDSECEIWYFSQNFEEIFNFTKKEILEIEKNCKENNFDKKQIIQEIVNEKTVEEILESVNWYDYQAMRSTAAQFLFDNQKKLDRKFWILSEGQKALLQMAKIVFSKPNILVLDEPTNHINFKHIPKIIEMMKNFRWVIILVSHDKKFLDELPIAKVIDLDEKKMRKWRDFKREILNKSEFENELTEEEKRFIEEENNKKWIDKNFIKQQKILKKRWKKNSKSELIKAQIKMKNKIMEI